MQKQIATWVTVLSLLLSINILAQSANPLRNNYNCFYLNVEKVNDSSLAFKTKEKTLRAKSFTIVADKNDYIYIDFTSNYNMFLYLESNDRSVYKVFAGARAENYDGSGSVIYTEFKVQKKDSFHLFVVNNDKSDVAFFNLGLMVLNPSAFNSNREEATFENRLETLLDFRKLKLQPLKQDLLTGKETDPYSDKTYSTFFELIKGTPMTYYKPWTSDAYIETSLFKTSTRAAAIAELNKYKNKLDTWFKSNKKITSSTVENEEDASLTGISYTDPSISSTPIIDLSFKNENGVYILAFKMR